jgi:hypothetical protein
LQDALSGIRKNDRPFGRRRLYITLNSPARALRFTVDNVPQLLRREW